jgi:mRNA-degrading endonuclease toxin of MazEF toxin-antitoxin module
LVISVNPINDLCPDVLVVPITTKEGPLRVLLGEQSNVTGLKMKSYAKCESLGPVHKARLKKRIGRVSKTDFLKIEEGVKRVLGF